jgi:hypothetical protein
MANFKSMNNMFDLTFNFDNYKRLDNFALLMCQDYNYGNSKNWFGAFRGGLYGFYSRISGVETHYHNVHAWLPKIRSPHEVEYHLSSIFFNMDSSVECLIYSLNALGNAIDSKSFRDISTASGIRQIKPNDMIGNSKKEDSQLPLIGYKKYFQNVQTHWQNSKKLLSIIIEQHDVSKHRETIFIGGMTRLDTPNGFFESLGITDIFSQAMLRPMAEIILQNEPKIHRLNANENESSTKKHLLLENLATDFCNFINKTGELIYKDSTDNINLKYKEFKKTNN